MKKTTEEELNQWRYSYPSTTVSWNLSGDPTYCQQFIGEAKNMLYRLKNRMNIAVPKLKSLQDIHHYDGGTVITVRSIFGQDFIEINAGRGFPSCLIKLLDLPLVIPPMKWYAPGLETWEKVGGAWIIKNPNGVVEVEGVDYIKTYFSWVTRDCLSCAPVEFTVAKGDDANILTGSSPNRPFWYKSENDDGSLIYDYQGTMVPHFMGYTTDLGIVIPDNPLKHTIYSLWDVCQAQIMKNGAKWSFSDAGGSYFLWKAYTEWSNVGPHVVDFSRTGLGYMLMQAFIKNEGIKLCETDGTIIKVDCCLKPEGDREVILYWESIGPGLAGGTTCTDQPFMFYGSIKICEVPSVIGPLWAMVCTPRNTKTFYVIPEIKGGCLPFTWELSGGGGWTLESSKPLGEMAGLSYECTLGSPDCNATLDVTVTDRCGMTDTFHSKSCCEADPSPLSIGYTSLLMACGGQQTLTAGGGCGPYNWSLSGVGSLSATEGSSVVYTAPATNPNCQNPTISLTDCCGATASIKLAVSCSVPGTAFCQCTVSCTGLECVPWGSDWNCNATLHWTQKTWDCNGDLLSEISSSNYSWWDACGGANCLSGCTKTGSCTCENLVVYYENKGWTGYGCGSEPKCNSSLKDVRTALMKENGCCPINPLTGLPYD